MIGQLPGPALLFCPADRPDRFAKAAAAADGVILDLEDGVAAADRPRARRALRETVLDPLRAIVRINPAGTADHDEDLRALADTPYTIVMLAKTESAEQVAAVAPRRVVALCETPRGVLAAAGIAAVPTTIGVMWGAEDLVAALGGRSSRDQAGRYRDVALHARASVLLAAGAHGRVAVDSVYLDIADVDGLAAEARDAVASGFAAKACIHPRQVAAVRQAFAPSADEVAWARRVLDAAAHSAGVFSFEGRMVDAPVLRHAERTLAATGHDPAVTVTDSPTDQRRCQGLPRSVDNPDPSPAWPGLAGEMWRVEYGLAASDRTQPSTTLRRELWSAGRGERGDEGGVVSRGPEPGIVEHPPEEGHGRGHARSLDAQL